MLKSYTHRKLEVDLSLKAAALAEWRAVHNPNFYKLDVSRQRMSKALARTLTYHLRRPNVPLGTIVKTESAQHVLDCVDTPLYAKFPALQALLTHVGDRYHGGWATVGRVFVTRLEGNANIGRHIDEGTYFESLHRHHFVLRSDGSTFCWDNDQVKLLEGDVWVVNNSVPHWVENSGGPRTHVIFDAVGNNTI